VSEVVKNPLFWSRPGLALVLFLSAVLFPGIGWAADGPPAPGAPAAAVPSDQPALEITAGDSGISVHAVAVQADEFFTKLARATGVGIIIDDTVGRSNGGAYTCRKVTVHLTNKKVSEIIESICTAYGLSHSQVGGVFMISEGIPKNPSSYLMSDIDFVTTQYVAASNAKSLLPVFLQDHVKINEEQNAVILSAPTEVIAKFREDIKQFDVPAAQIMIDVLMVEFTDAAAKELGFDFIWSNSGKGVATSSGTGDVIFRSIATLPKEFTAQIKALVEKRVARVHANPKIATVSGQKATIFVGRQKYLSEPVEVHAEDVPWSGSMNYIDAGIRLAMTPWTGGEGEIIAEIEPEVSVLSAPDPVTRLPEKTTRRADTIVRVRDGDTIIIGGLTQSELQSTKTKIPLLGDLPIIGRLFTGVNRTRTTTELVIFITPHILRDTDRLSAEEKQKLMEKLEAEPREGKR